MPIQLLWFWTITAFVFGITVGSFLNVVIYRLPRGGSLVQPEHSYCPNCKRQLNALDLVPLFSFLFLGCKCRGCKLPISWRYFGVELLTGVLFAALYLSSRDNVPNAIAFILFTAILVPITFIDLDFFMIPSSLNILAFMIAISRDIWGIATHEAGHQPLWGWLPWSIVGAVAGTLIFGVVRVSGWLWKRVEAMGLGDVFLARGMGALLVSVVPAGGHPLRLFVMWVLLSCASGLIVGPALIFLRKQQAKHKGDSVTNVEESRDVLNFEKKFEDDLEAAEPESSLIEQLKEVGYVLWLADFWEYLGEKLAALRGQPVAPMNYEDDDWKPEASAIPFGPFLSVGFLATIFVGELLTNLYLAKVLHWGAP